MTQLLSDARLPEEFQGFLSLLNLIFDDLHPAEVTPVEVLIYVSMVEKFLVDLHPLK